jgi:drug/metabolite transporter (DMT)-like permease
MTWEILLFILIILAGTAGELCVARAMKAVGEVTEFHPAAIIRTIIHALRNGWMWIGVGLMAMAFFALLGALSLENVSFVVPVTALNYVVGALGGKLFLREKVTPKRWAGVLLVCVGVTLVILGGR